MGEELQRFLKNVFRVNGLQANIVAVARRVAMVVCGEAWRAREVRIKADRFIVQASIQSRGLGAEEDNGRDGRHACEVPRAAVVRDQQ